MVLLHLKCEVEFGVVRGVGVEMGGVCGVCVWWDKKGGGIKTIFNARTNECIEDLYLLL